MSAPDRYLDYPGREDRLSGGVRRIPIGTPRGRFTVWTKRVGNNPALKVLLLHGGPGAPTSISRPATVTLAVALLSPDRSVC